jgi:anti-sigma B factor antagonist
MRFEAAAVALDRGTQVVAVAGELDRATGPALERALRTAPKEVRGAVIVDLTGCVFMDSAGLGVLERTHRRIGRSGGRLAVVVENRSILKLFRLTGLDRLLDIYPSCVAALNGDGQ